MLDTEYRDQETRIFDWTLENGFKITFEGLMKSIDNAKVIRSGDRTECLDEYFLKIDLAFERGWLTALESRRLEAAVEAKFG